MKKDEVKKLVTGFEDFLCNVVGLDIEDFDDFMSEIGRRYPKQKGMILRDYFSARAMQGIMTDSAYGIDDGPDVAKIAYAIADAMIEERNK